VGERPRERGVEERKREREKNATGSKGENLEIPKKELVGYSTIKRKLETSIVLQRVEYRMATGSQIGIGKGQRGNWLNN
jgi:hypothetical protein